MANPTSINFGDVPVGGNSAQPVVLSNVGNASLIISQANVTGAGFNISGLSLPLTLNAGQSIAFSVRFTPQAIGSAAGSVSILNSGSNFPTTLSLAGNGVSSSGHFVSLTWDVSTSAVPGYNVYRGSTTGGPYSKINPSLVVGNTFADNTVQPGQSYFYVATAVDANNVESQFSNEAQAVVPSP